MILYSTYKSSIYIRFGVETSQVFHVEVQCWWSYSWNNNHDLSLGLVIVLKYKFILRQSLEVSHLSTLVLVTNKGNQCTPFFQCHSYNNESQWFDCTLNKTLAKTEVVKDASLNEQWLFTTNILDHIFGMPCLEHKQTNIALIYRTLSSLVGFQRRCTNLSPAGYLPTLVGNHHWGDSPALRAIQGGEWLGYPMWMPGTYFMSRYDKALCRWKTLPNSSAPGQDRTPTPPVSGEDTNP